MKCRVCREAAVIQLRRHNANFCQEHFLRLCRDQVAKATKRSPCSACGLSKRHVFDEAALSGGYGALATGHNLDDEASVLFGNVLRWQTEYLARQQPVLEAQAGFPKKVTAFCAKAQRSSKPAQSKPKTPLAHAPPAEHPAPTKSAPSAVC